MYILNPDTGDVNQISAKEIREYRNNKELIEIPYQVFIEKMPTDNKGYNIESTSGKRAQKTPFNIKSSTFINLQEKFNELSEVEKEEIIINAIKESVQKTARHEILLNLGINQITSIEQMKKNLKIQLKKSLSEGQIDQPTYDSLKFWK